MIQDAQRGLHGHGIRIVIIFDQGIRSGLRDPETSAHRFHGFDAGADLIRSQSADRSDRSRCRRIEDHVLARKRDRHLKLLLIHADRALRSFQSQGDLILHIDPASGREPVENGALPVNIIDLQELVVLAAQDHGPGKLHIVQTLRFGREYAVPVLQVLQVAGPDVGDDHDVGLCRLRQPGHFPEMADSHLQDRDLVLFRHPEDRERQSEVIIEVSLGLQRAVLLRQHGGDHLLGAGLSD